MVIHLSKSKMYRYFFVLAICAHAFALPVSNGINDSLKELAKNCGNKAIAAAIEKQAEDCSVSVPPYDKKQVQCLLFYDMNKQLCSASVDTALQQEDITKKLNDKMKTLDLCKVANKWILNELEDYPLYHNNTAKLFDNELSCVKICSDPDLFSDLSNFYCNYYQWGTQLLQSITPVSQTQSNYSITKTDKSVDLSSPTQLEAEDTVAEKSTVNEAIAPVKVESKVTEETTKDNVTKPDSDKGPEVVAVSNVAVDNPDNSKPAPASQEEPKSKIPKLEDTENKMDKPITKDKKLSVNPDDIKDLPPADGEDEDYQDMDEAKDEFPEPNSNLNVNSVDEKLPPVEDEAKKQNNDKTPLTSFDSEIEPKVPAMAYGDDSYPSSDDNFLPFFLSVVIAVVLLYVLYHNKSRVTKMVLGLIVEGRQQNRRRNSRGHFYRRLDTLEHAMNSDTAAAPSKIIY